MPDPRESYITYISNAISNKDRRSRKALLSRPGHICHPNTDDQTNHRPKESNNRISNHRRGGVVGPSASPDHGAASDDRETAEDEENEANIGDAA